MQELALTARVMFHKKDIVIPGNGYRVVIAITAAIRILHVKGDVTVVIVMLQIKNGAMEEHGKKQVTAAIALMRTVRALPVQTIAVIKTVKNGVKKENGKVVQIHNTAHIAGRKTAAAQFVRIMYVTRAIKNGAMEEVGL